MKSPIIKLTKLRPGKQMNSDLNGRMHGDVHNLSQGPSVKFRRPTPMSNIVWTPLPFTGRPSVQICSPPLEGPWFRCHNPRIALSIFVLPKFIFILPKLTELSAKFSTTSIYYHLLKAAYIKYRFAKALIPPLPLPLRSVICIYMIWFWAHQNRFLHNLRILFKPSTPLCFRDQVS